MVTKTIGSGGDYADMGLAWADIVAFADDYTYTIISDFTENNGVPAASPKQYQGFTVTIENPNGYVVTIPTDGSGGLKNWKFVALLQTATDKMVFDGIVFNLASINPANAFSFLTFSPGSQYAYVSATYKNLKFIGSGYQASTAARNSACIGYDGAAGLQWTNAEIYNCIFYNFGTCFNGQTIGASQTIKIENCTSYDCYNGIFLATIPAGASVLFKNMGICECENSDFATGISGAILTNCADSDGTIATSGATYTNSQTGIVAADEYRSLDSASADFLKLNKGAISSTPTVLPTSGKKPISVRFNNNTEYVVPSGVLYNSGTIPTLTNTDLAGNTYGQYGDYPIGCYNSEIDI